MWLSSVVRAGHGYYKVGAHKHFMNWSECDRRMIKFAWEHVPLDKFLLELTMTIPSKSIVVIRQFVSCHSDWRIPFVATSIAHCRQDRSNNADCCVSYFMYIIGIIVLERSSPFANVATVERPLHERNMTYAIALEKDAVRSR